MPRTGVRGRTRFAGAQLTLPIILAVGFGDPAAMAVEELPDEKALLKACESQICGMIVGKAAKGGNLQCKLAKTWAKSTIEKGKNKTVRWGFGDAQCSVTLNLSSADIVAALTQPAHTINVPAHKVNCVVEREGEAQKVTAKVAPKLIFKNGQADKVWINLTELEGPESIKGTVWMAATLEDKLGIFHKSMIKSINKFVQKRCPEHWRADGTEIETAKPPVAAAAAKAKPAAASTAAVPAAKAVTSAAPPKVPAANSAADETAGPPNPPVPAAATPADPAAAETAKQ